MPLQHRHPAARFLQPLASTRRAVVSIANPTAIIHTNPGNRVNGIKNIARIRNELMSSGLKSNELEQLATLLRKIAAAHGLTPTVHLRYKDLKPPPRGTRKANKAAKSQP